MAEADPLGEVKRAIVAVGKLPDELSLSDAQGYWDGSDVDFEVDGTGFVYVHTPIEFAEGKSRPDQSIAGPWYGL